jgi:uncharacterized Zn ribbon protein
VSGPRREHDRPGVGDHDIDIDIDIDIDCRVDGIGPMQLKSSIAKKA